ncbi:50S ribosomal protein L31 [Candidatus Kaiserbacteria bacterium RIFCSPLOWO2_12_FULL_53_8]|uniref:50S ribosomal protein L31 n=1 Tax=Candidatus Kaiserbacteria bacterium RIFCSPLOWO2_12_FULL_53_8 TaxID=1798529 RepID=A0A1F6FY56_9BACT|nr:MAG: 50S ribosomal protein L31 [Candidatus Kaiserbacteria bacterium RIFCSPLOWO2_12_FULL_53_8]
MKADIHPQVFKDAKVTCTSCKAVFIIPGTVKDQQVEICSQCHPVYTGKFRALQASGQVDKFKKKMATAEQAKVVAKPNKRKLTQDEKLRKKLEEAKIEKEEKKKIVAEKDRERAKKAAEKTVIKKGEKKKEE